MTLRTLIFMLGGMSLVSCARILMMRSTERSVPDYELLAEKLASRDHQIAYLTTDMFRPNVSGIVSPWNAPSIKNAESPSLLGWMSRISSESEECDQLYLNNRENVKSLLDDNKDVDLVILDHECLIPFAFSLNAQVVHLRQASLETSLLQNPNVLSSGRMSSAHYHQTAPFVERLLEFLVGLGVRLLQDWWYYPAIDSAVDDESLPRFADMLQNVSVVLRNADTVLSQARPMYPSVVNVFGMHCRPPKKLAPDVEKLLENSDDGFIMVSMDAMHYEDISFVNTLVEVFSNMRMPILWKLEMEIKNCPPNVRIVKWLPQQDLLGHPKIVAFITDGDVHSLQEAIYHGVPVVGLSDDSEQVFNLRILEHKGMGMAYPLHNITSNILLKGITTVLNNPSFRKNAKLYSTIMKDQPESALERVLYWMEYLTRHKDVSNVLISDSDLTILQYYSIDLLAVLILQSATAVMLLCVLTPMSIFTFKQTFKYSVTRFV